MRASPPFAIKPTSSLPAPLGRPVIICASEYVPFLEHEPFDVVIEELAAVKEYVGVPPPMEEGEGSDLGAPHIDF